MSSMIKEFTDNILALAASSGESSREIFFDQVTEMLIEAGDLNNANYCYFQRHGLQIDGFSFDEAFSNQVLTIFLIDFDPQCVVDSINKGELESSFKRGANLLTKLLSSDFRRQLEDSHIVTDFAELLNSRFESLLEVKFVLITNRILSIRSSQLNPPLLLGKRVSVYLYDGNRIESLIEGDKFQPIIIDLQNVYGESLPLLTAHTHDDSLRSYLTVIPGELLASIFKDWGNRLLEKNVRVFLQARGKVNKGIKETIATQPSMFFAFNNGICATADKIKTERNGNVLILTQLENFQIVNGGQTTASIYRASIDKSQIESLKKVKIPLKLTVIEEENFEKSNEIVSRISECANSQNSVNIADFDSNSPFHLAVEKLSRRLTMPAPRNSLVGTKWFYERSRGQYADLRSRCNTAKQKRQFDELHPKSQVIKKTDLARHIHIWEGLPHIVSKGAQRNFVDFSQKVKQSEWQSIESRINEYWFKSLAVKAFLYNQVCKLISDQKDTWYGGYRANIAAYTLSSLALHLKSVNNELDYLRIWKEQEISATFKEELLKIAFEVNNLLISPPKGLPQNVTEYAKIESCFKRIQSAGLSWSNAIDEYSIPLEEHRRREKEGRKEMRSTVNSVYNEVAIFKADSNFWHSLKIFCDGKGIATAVEINLIAKLINGRGRYIPTEIESKKLYKLYVKSIGSGFTSRLPE